MHIETLINKVKFTNYIDTKEKESLFKNSNPGLYEEIISITSDIEKTRKENFNLRARVIFLIKYKLNLKLLKFKNYWKVFDEEIDDFIVSEMNSAKKGWDNKFKKLESVNTFSLEKTISEVKKLKKEEIYGKSVNRKLMSSNLSLYKSILFYSEPLNILNKVSNKFPARVLFIKNFKGNLENLICKNCNKDYCKYNIQRQDFNSFCKECYYNVAPKYPQKKWFILKYGKNWEKFYEKDRIKISSFKVNSKEWFINKYGIDESKKMREKYIFNMVERIKNLKTKRFSKISQELFWSIYDKLSIKDNCYFKELNSEFFLRKNEFIFFPDFVYKNKIIEYDGIYWHDSEKDDIRNKIYEDLGYEVLIINSDEYNRKNKPKEIINKCLNFLENETK